MPCYCEMLDGIVHKRQKLCNRRGTLNLNELWGMLRRISAGINTREGEKVYPLVDEQQRGAEAFVGAETRHLVGRL